MTYDVIVGGRPWKVTVDGGRVIVDGEAHQAELRPVPATPECVLVLDGVTQLFSMENPDRGRWVVVKAGERHEAEVVDERTATRKIAGALPGGPVALTAPMPGLVVRVLAEPGKSVAAGASLVVLEAMKMENELKAAAPGIVDRVSVVPGQTVEKGELLVSFRSP